MCKYACRGTRNLRIVLDGRESYLSRLRDRLTGLLEVRATADEQSRKYFFYSISSKWLTIIHVTNDSFCRKRVTKKFQKFFKKMESEEMREGHLSWYLYLNLFKDPVCKCAQKLSQVSFGCTFLFGSTVVMINLIMFVHLRNVYSEIYSER